MATGVFIARVIACSHGCSHVQRSRGSSRGRTGVGMFACSRGFSHVRGWSWVFAGVRLFRWLFARSCGCSRDRVDGRALTRSRVHAVVRLFACSRGCSHVRGWSWGVCGCSLVPVVVRAVVRWFTRSRGWSRAHAFAVARGCSRVRMFTLVFECINVFTRVFVFAWVYQVRTGVRVFARVFRCLRAWAMHAPFLRTDGTMDVIMVRPWMPGSQVGLDSGVIMVGPAMDALRVCARAYYPPTTIRCSDLIPATYPVVDPNTMGGIVDYPHLILLLISSTITAREEPCPRRIWP